MTCNAIEKHIDCQIAPSLSNGKYTGGTKQISSSQWHMNAPLNYAKATKRIRKGHVPITYLSLKNWMHPHAICSNITASNTIISKVSHAAWIDFRKQRATFRSTSKEEPKKNWSESEWFKRIITFFLLQYLRCHETCVLKNWVIGHKAIGWNVELALLKKTNVSFRSVQQ